MGPGHPSGWLGIEHLGDITVAKFTTRLLLDEAEIQIVGEQLLSLVSRLGGRPLLLNFAAVERMSSAMLGQLLVLQKKVQAAGSRLALCQIRPPIAEIFALVGFGQLFEIYADEQEALQTSWVPIASLAGGDS